MLIIRKMRRQDLSKLAEIYVRAYDRPRFGEKWKRKDALALLNFYAEQEKFLGCTAVLDGKIAGAFFSFVKPWYDGNHLGEGELFVDPRYQSKGIGTQLMITMVCMAKAKKCTTWELLAYPNTARWYRKLGMKDSGLRHMDGNISAILRRLRV